MGFRSSGFSNFAQIGQTLYKVLRLGARGRRPNKAKGQKDFYIFGVPELDGVFWERTFGLELFLRLWSDCPEGTHTKRKAFSRGVVAATK